jgi:hypothetical protein
MRTPFSLQVAIAGLALLALGGCISPKSYVDPLYHQADYADIVTPEEKIEISVSAEFLVNGERKPKVDKHVLNSVERSLRSTGLFTPAETPQPNRLKVIVNNLGAIGDAAAKGFGTGLTFGLMGSHVTDYYEITVEYAGEENLTLTETYKHAIHSTIGRADAPIENVEPTDPADAFSTVIDDVMLNFARDYQQRKSQTSAGAPQPLLQGFWDSMVRLAQANAPQTAG